MSQVAPKTTEFLMYWLGENPPSKDFHYSINPLVGETGFRESPSLHGVFSEVHASEIDLGQLKCWPVILDELIRLIRIDHDKTTLVIRFAQSKMLSIFKLANFLRNRDDATFELLGSDSSPDGTTVMKFSVFRKHVRPSLMSFEFSVITNGARNDSLFDFISSVKQIEGIEQIDWGISVCGPKSMLEILKSHHPDVKFIKEPEQFTDKAWITKKKNLLVDSTNRENILVTHDRYLLPKNFLNEMFRFGSDFDVISPAQFLRNGERFPDKVALNSNWSWSPSMLMAYDDYHPYEYINGGAIIAKTSILRRFPWNDLLFWNQAEDVELSRQLQANSIVVRNSIHISLLVGEVRDKYLDTFLLCPDTVDSYPLVTQQSEFAGFTFTDELRDQKIDLRHFSNHGDFFRNGIDFFRHDWVITPRGLSSVGEIADLQIEAGENVSEILLNFLSSRKSRITFSVSNGNVLGHSPGLNQNKHKIRLQREIPTRPIRVTFSGAQGLTIQSISRLLT